VGNKLVDLNNHLFVELERLNLTENLENEEFNKEIERAKAITSIGNTIVSNAKLALETQKYIDLIGDKDTVPLMLQSKEDKNN